MSIDAAARGDLMGKSVEVAKALLENMDTNNYHWSSERAPLRKGSGKYDINTVDMWASKLDAFAKKFDRMGTPYLGSPSGMMYEVSGLCEIYGNVGH